MNNSEEKIKAKHIPTKKQHKNRVLKTILTVVAVLLLVTGVALLVIEPIQNYFRNSVTKDA